MLYKNGREAVVGDKVVGVDAAGNFYAGTLIGILNTEASNLVIAPIGTPTQLVTASESLPVEKL